MRRNLQIISVWTGLLGNQRNIQRFTAHILLIFFPPDYIKQLRPNNQTKERSLFQNFETFIIVQLKKN